MPSPPIPPPEFKPDIPDYLLANCSSAERYVIESVSVLNKKTDWQSGELTRQALVQDDILSQITATNGDVRQAKADIIELKQQAHQSSKDLKILDGAIKIVSNKWFWFVAFAFFLGFLPWIYSFHFTLHDLISVFLDRT